MAARHITVGIRKGDVRGSDNRAIQIAVDALGAEGGTVEILAGTYNCIDSVHLRSGVRLVGQGERTMLRRVNGFRAPIKIGADYGQLKITPVDISPFRVGQGLYVRDNRSHGWLDSIITVERIEGGGLIIGAASERLVNNYHFYATFEEKTSFGVREGEQEIGTIQTLPAVGDRFRLAGRAWEVTEVDEDRRIIQVDR